MCLTYLGMYYRLLTHRQGGAATEVKHYDLLPTSNITHHIYEAVMNQRRECGFTFGTGT